MAQKNSLHLFFHRDFDGICSAAVFLAYALRSDLADPRKVGLMPVDYDIKGSWADTRLPEPSAIVDFLYRPDADWWFDHHPTTFLKAEWEASFKPDERHVWNTGYKSCPGLIIDSLREDAIRIELKDRFREHVSWSEIIDMAEYSSPQQVVEAKEPALQINLSLAIDNNAEYSTFLVKCLGEKSLAEVASLEEVALRCKRAMSWQDKAISYMATVGEVRKGVAFFDLTGRDRVFHRYAAYYLRPDVRFIVAVYRNGQGFKITVGSNPWADFNGPDLSTLCEQYGGGGHAQVGGIALSDKRRALKVGMEIARKLRRDLPFTEQLPFRMPMPRQSS